MSTDQHRANEETKNIPGESPTSAGDSPVKHQETTIQASHSGSPHTATTVTTSQSAIDEQNVGKRSALSRESEATPTDAPSSRPIIAVSASKGPAAFFNLARKFLATDEMCDLSALEGAIVSAVDAAHLLERSQLAKIVRVNTSYVTVEPKRKKYQQLAAEQGGNETQEGSGESQENIEKTERNQAYPPLETISSSGMANPRTVENQKRAPTEEYVQSGQRMSATAVASFRNTKSSPGRELRRARIVITVRRTDIYEQWLEENPIQTSSTEVYEPPELPTKQA